MAATLVLAPEAAAEVSDAAWPDTTDTTVPGVRDTADASEPASPGVRDTADASEPASPAGSWFPAPAPAWPGKLGAARGAGTGS